MKKIATKGQKRAKIKQYIEVYYVFCILFFDLVKTISCKNVFCVPMFYKGIDHSIVYVRTESLQMEHFQNVEKYPIQNVRLLSSLHIQHMEK